MGSNYLTMSPYLDGPVCACSNHLIGLSGMVLSPSYHLAMDLWWGIGLECCSLIRWFRRVFSMMTELTSTRSHAQTRPSSSPQTTLASACPKHARHRYDVCVCPPKELSILPVPISKRRTCESRVATRKVVPSADGITDVTGSVEKRENRIQCESTKTNGQ